MSLITRMRRQTCVYWPPAAANSHGQPLWGTPVQLACRYEDGEHEVHTAQNEILQTGATAYIAGTDGTSAIGSPTPLVGGMLALGTLTSSMNSANPRESGAKEIVHVRRMPNFRATEVLRQVWMER